MDVEGKKIIFNQQVMPDFNKMSEPELRQELNALTRQIEKSEDSMELSRLNIQSMAVRRALGMGIGQ